VFANCRQWWASLATEPEPLTRGERRAAWIVTFVAAVTRWLALSRSPWDWDEALFMLGLRDFNVPAHHPHPPGFPLFIGTAKLLTFLRLSDFHALQAISFVAAVAIVPATLMLGRELRLSARTSLVAGVFLAIFPNVWFFGGTAFSDIPSMTLAIVTVALFLRGCRSDAAFIGGAIILGIAAGYRPQNLTIGFAPAVIASLRGLPRHWLRPIVAALIIAAIVVVSYGVAAQLSGGWTVYRGAVKAHQKYITEVDSFRNPQRPPLWRLFDDFFIRPYRMPLVNTIVSLLAAISLIASVARLRAPILAILAAFGPFCLAAWLVLDHFSVSRFSIGYAPLFAILAADGLHLALGRWPRLEAWSAAAFALFVTIWIWPALREVHRHDSPTFAATEWIRRHADARSATLFVHGSMQPLVEAFLPGVPFVATGDATPVAAASSRPGDVFVIEGATATGGATILARPRRRIFSLVRDRYFEVSIIRLQQLITFEEGWYDPEGSGTSGWRWMAKRARALLPPIRGRASLTLRMYVPLDVMHTPPNVDVWLNGVKLDRIHAADANFERTWIVDARGDAPNELVIETDRVVNPAREHIIPDPRDLGVRVSDIEWSGVR
jgi:MFS family permease